MVKNLLANAGNTVLIPGLGRSTAVGNGNPFQCSCLENSMDRGIWWVTVHAVAESDMTKHNHFVETSLNYGCNIYSNFF